MATAERREARRRKLLQNPEDRLQRILGSRLNHPTTSRSQFEPSESLLNSASTEKQDVSNEKKLVTDPKPSENITVEKDVLSVTKDVEDQTDDRKTTEETVCESQDIETDRGNYLDNEFKDVPEATSLSQNPCTVPSPPVAGVNETVEHVSLGSKSGIWTRVIFNVTLAFVLVSKWTYVNLEVLLSTNGKQGPVKSQKVLIQSEVGLSRQVSLIQYSVHPPLEVGHKGI